MDLIVFSNDQNISMMVEGRLDLADKFGTPLESGLPLYVDFNVWPSAMGGRPSDTEVLFEKCPSPYDLDEQILRHARFGMIPITIKFCVRRERERLVNLLAGIGAHAVPHGVRDEMIAIRERLRVLSAGEPRETVNAIEAMCGIA
ncbi:MAG: hypothetical protein ACLQRH_01455 [Acidimicrobiales bacterium]